MHIPAWFERQLTDFRGKSLYGEPILRVVFGANERDFAGRYKYINPTGGPMERWVLERWQSAGFFGSRQAWEDSDRFYDDVTQKTVNLKGPFPERGAYTMVCPITGNSGEFVPLDETVMTGIKEKVRNDELFASLSVAERNALVAAKDDRETAARTYETERKQDFIREYHVRNWDKENRSHTTAYNITPR